MLLSSVIRTSLCFGWPMSGPHINYWPPSAPNGRILEEWNLGIGPTSHEVLFCPLPSPSCEQKKRGMGLRVSAHDWWEWVLGSILRLSLAISRLPHFFLSFTKKHPLCRNLMFKTSSLLCHVPRGASSVADLVIWPWFKITSSVPGFSFAINFEPLTIVL